MKKVKYETKDKALLIVASDGMELQYVSDELKNDRDVVIMAIKQCGLALEYASATLRAEKEIVVIAAKQNGWAAFMSSNKDLYFDKEVMLAALKNNDENWEELKTQIGIHDLIDSNKGLV